MLGSFYPVFFWTQLWVAYLFFYQILTIRLSKNCQSSTTPTKAKTAVIPIYSKSYQQQLEHFQGFKTRCLCGRVDSSLALLWYKGCVVSSFLVCQKLVLVKVKAFFTLRLKPTQTCNSIFRSGTDAAVLNSRTRFLRIILYRNPTPQMAQQRVQLIKVRENPVRLTTQRL